MRMKKKNSYYSEKQIQKLEEIAEATGITVAEHLRRAVDSYIKSVARPSTKEGNGG